MKVKVNRDFAERAAIYGVPASGLIAMGLFVSPVLIPAGILAAIAFGWIGHDPGSDYIEIEIGGMWSQIKQDAAKRQYKDWLHGLKQAARYGNNESAREKLKLLGEDW